MAHRAILTGLGPVCSCNRVLKLHEHLSFGVRTHSATTTAACMFRRKSLPSLVCIRTCFPYDMLCLKVSPRGRPGLFKPHKVQTSRSTRQLSMQTVQAVQSGEAVIYYTSARISTSNVLKMVLVGTSEEQDYEAFDQHQSSAARLDFAEEARTLLEVARYRGFTHLP